ncbi:MAG: LysR family transcriptional regulator [Polyangiaceae bacterium]
MDRPEIDLNDVRVFVAVVQTQSFTAAGRVLDMPRSTVSRRIAKLEKQLGARLLHRTTRRVQLTDIGTSYFDRCAKSLAQIEEAEALVRASQETPQGRLRITAPNDLARFLSPVVARFLADYPDVSIEIDMSQHFVDLIAEGIDLALRASSQMPDSSLIARKIAGGSAVLCAGPGYLEKHGVPERLQDLMSHDCITLGGRSASWRVIQRGNEVQVPVNSRLTANDPRMVRDLVVENAGIGVVPSFLVAEALQEGLVKRVLPDCVARAASLYVVYPSARHLSATVRAFRDALIESFVDIWSEEAPRSIPPPV